MVLVISRVLVTFKDLVRIVNFSGLISQDQVFVWTGFNLYFVIW